MVSHLSQPYPNTLRPFGAGYPVPAALESVEGGRFRAFLAELEAIALYDPQTLPQPLLRPQIEQLAGPHLWTDLLGEAHQRAVYQKAWEMNRYRGCQRALDVFSRLCGLGYYYRLTDVNGHGVGKPDQDSPPDRIYFYIVNRAGLPQTSAVLDYIADAYAALLPRFITVDKPLRIATEGVGQLAAVAVAKTARLWDGRTTTPILPGQSPVSVRGSFDRSFGPSFARYIPAAPAGG